MAGGVAGAGAGSVTGAVAGADAVGADVPRGQYVAASATTTTKRAIATHMVLDELLGGGVLTVFGRLKSFVMVLVLLNTKTPQPPKGSAALWLRLF